MAGEGVPDECTRLAAQVEVALVQDDGEEFIAGPGQGKQLVSRVQKMIADVAPLTRADCDDLRMD